MKVSKKMSATKRYRVIMDMNNLKMVMHNLSVEWRDNATLCAAVVRNCCITIFFNDKTHVEALLVLFIYPAINAIVATFRRCLRTNMEISWCYRPKKIFMGFAYGGAYLLHIPEQGRGDIKLSAAKISIKTNSYLYLIMKSRSEQTWFNEACSTLYHCDQGYRR